MSMKLIRASSGTYNVRAEEMARDRPQMKTVKCIVHFLDETKESFEVDKRAKAGALLDIVYDHLELIEKDYFGLQFADVAPAPDAMVRAGGKQGPTRRWLDPLKNLKKQIRLGPPYTLEFAVKFYVCDPCKLTDEYTRYHFFLQLKKDILEGKLVCPPTTAALLASYAVQSELGDYNPEEHTDGYLSEFRFIPNQTENFEREVSELHKQHKGQMPADAEYNYLDVVKRLDMYGVDVHLARDQSNMDIQLGVASAGLVVFQNSVKINTFSWAKIVKISFKRKQFFIQLRREIGTNNNDNIDNLIGFYMTSYRSCKNLWKSCVEHHTFFRLHKPNPPIKKKLLSLGSKFRYSGRTEFQTLEDGKRRARIERTFSRSPSKRYARRTVGGTTRDVIMDEKNVLDGYRNAPVNNGPVNNHVKQSRSMNSTINLTRNYDGYGRSPRSSFQDYRRKSNTQWSDNQSEPDEGGFVPPVPAKMQDYYLDENTSMSQQSFELPDYHEFVPNGNGFVDGQGLVVIRMRPDDQGRFGFNVKSVNCRGRDPARPHQGGADQGMPIIVSRVAPGSPADLCIPRLNEGDQVLQINRRDVSTHSHEQVVMFIRATRENHSGELELIVRPNVYVGDDPVEEPEFQYIPDTHHISTTTHGDVLAESLLLLQEGIESGAAVAQFEQLYRKKPGMTMNAARLPENIPKNRYRDISPYDQTRVVIKNGPDYINANFVNMEIPGSGIVNRYIAAQGPLPNTVVDYWEMIWEQQSTLVVMLTTKMERGRVKCHQYWPNLYETEDLGALQLTCLKEQETPSFAFREFLLVNMDTNEERHIVQMQYIAWPDHGVPDDSSDFLDFVIRVRQNRVGMVEPTVVHCSAGIGRTGVLITMETAMCLIEANQPVYPLDIVRQMRDQRAMLIQTASQYRFVCEAILRVYSEGIVKPLDDYQR
ncbi:tyrosine-protein phosphatase non-receptor type 4 isoform X4 [Lingula anatina]|uniref:Tyrosine-protein phosphatase n=1 Tax=Lingula anatina TaxID=7574 RepID=A0A1S3IDS7_LINAN|nr:tyrosine-protein phosphatase non-receptor type 4 isoform X4 [Lingula anatina]|eukprot:XP_013395604.1 tyrosine-protein phosphatase non-receptor type 4 isoform X4 [Lingula anatina]